MTIEIVRSNVTFNWTRYTYAGTYNFDANGLNDNYANSMIELMRKSAKAVDIIYAIKKNALKTYVFVNSSQLCKFYSPWEVRDWGLSINNQPLDDDEALIAWDPGHSASKTVFWYDDYATRAAPTEMAQRAPTGADVHVGQQDQTICLLHEFGHAYDYLNRTTWYDNQIQQAIVHGDGAAFISIEDHNVMNNERPVAQDLGQGVRNYYRDRVR